LSSAGVRHNRIERFSIMAKNGKSEDEIFDKALSIGVTEATANSYIRALYARGVLS